LCYVFHVSCYVITPMQQQFNENEKENPLSSQEARPNFWQALEKNQKIALIVLAVFVLFLMIAWSVQFKRSLTEPFAYKGDNNQSNTTDNVAVADIDLKNKDTDGDGLSDWDELNVYKTSSYLEDSDSDGIKDGDEIKAGKDPNCPEGKTCSTTVPSGENTQASNTPSLLTGNQMDLSSVSYSDADLQALIQGESDPGKIRKLLLDAGMDKNVLSQISDADLVSSYREMFKQ